MAGSYIPDVPDINATYNGHRNLEILFGMDSPEDQTYQPCPEASPADGVPRSVVQKYPDWAGSSLYRGTARDIWIATPPGFDPAGPPAALAVFQDGIGYLSERGPVRAVAVMDSLLHGGEMPPTVGVFVMPGSRAGDNDVAVRAQRSMEYDTTDDTYVRFVLDELLPFVESELGARVTSDPAQRTAVGISSGGICAFNMAWQRPDAFGRVISHCGSFTALRGGHQFPAWVRLNERKPIRVFLQSGTGDAITPPGNWYLSNQLMADALQYAGYDVRVEMGVGAHSLRHGGALFADALRWLESPPGGRTLDDDAALKARVDADVADYLRNSAATD